MGLYFSNDPAVWRETDGVYIAVLEPPRSARLIGSRVTHVVGDFPIGPVDEVVEIADAETFLDRFVGEAASPENYKGYRSIADKVFGRLKIVRIQGTGAAKSSRTVRDLADAEDLFSATAKYVGAYGDEITLAFEQVDANTFNLVVSFGATTETFNGLARATTAFDDVESEIVDFAWLDADVSGALPASDVSAVALSGGTIGTINDLSYTGDASNVRGIRLFESTGDGGSVFYAEYTSAAAITAMRSHIAAHRRRGYVQADASDDFATNSAAAALISDDRLGLPLHRVTQRFSSGVQTVDLAPFLASIESQIPEHFSLADYDNSSLLLPVVGLPSGVAIGRSQWVEAQTVGGITIEALEGGGYKIHAGLTSDPNSPSMIETRMTDFVSASLGAALLPYQNKPPLTLYRDQSLAALEGVVKALKGDEELPESQYIEAGSVRFLSYASGLTRYQVKVKLWGEMRFLAVSLTVGENVEIDAQFAA